MPAALAEIPPKSQVFLDANVLVYALCGDSAECLDLLRRCAVEDVFGVVTLDVINDVTHKLMLREASDKAIIPRPRADLLNAKLSDIPRLTHYWQQAQRLLTMNLVILDLKQAWLATAHALRSAHGLMTNDSVIAATMTESGLAALASADSDFDRVPDIRRYAPTDLA